MKATLEKVTQEALSLSMDDRAALTRILIKALDSEAPDESTEMEKAWKAEVERRVDEIESGRVKTVPAEEVFAKLRAKHG
jgi:putative addiction module component (TIGR02574 family)